MRTQVAVAWMFVLSVACYNPSIKNKGYACSEEKPSCPAGFYCVDGLCQDRPGPGVGGVGERDLSVADGAAGGAGGGGGAGGAGGAGGGGGSGVVDMSVAPGPDMTTPADMAQCTAGQAGSVCLQNSDCCSGVCIVIVCA